MSIEPFGFDRVFRFASAEVEDKKCNAALHDELASLEARIERMREEHAAELVRVRADGFEVGLAQARNERDAALLAAADALHAGLDDIIHRFEDVTDQIAREAGSVALLAAEMLAGHAIALEPARAIDEALARALEQVARGTHLTVRVHPSMCEELERIVAVRQAGVRRAMSILVVGDPTVPPADARIGWGEGGLGVDAGARRAAVLAELAGLLGGAPDIAVPMGEGVEVSDEVADAVVAQSVQGHDGRSSAGLDAAA